MVNKRSVFVISILLILTLVFLSCNDTDEYIVDMKSRSEAIESADGKVVLTVNIMYPHINNVKKDSPAELINLIYEEGSHNYVRNVVDEYADEALHMYTDGFINTFYEFMVTSTVEFNKDNMLSITQTYVQYTGGAHSNTIQQSAVYDMKTGTELAPNDIIGGTYEETLQNVREMFITNINNHPDDYYENAIEIVNNTGFINYYLTDESLVFYFNEYEIAPYAAGIITVNLSR